MCIGTEIRRGLRDQKVKGVGIFDFQQDGIRLSDMKRLGVLTAQAAVCDIIIALIHLTILVCLTVVFNDSIIYILGNK